MAGIKSTMDLVLERAARMGIATPDEIRHGENLKTGMQYGAEYLNGQRDGLGAALQGLGVQEAADTREGMLDALLRNLFLPRDEDASKRIDRAMRGIVELNKGAADIASLCQELQGILSQYSDHRKQLYEQLKEQMRMQIEQLVMRKTGMPAGNMKIDPTLEPRFKEEWAQLEAEIDSQYGQAIGQFKAQIKARAAAGVK